MPRNCLFMRWCLHLPTTSVASLAVCTQANFLWAYATLGERVRVTYLEALAAQARRELRLFKVGHVASMLWSLCVMRVCLPEAAVALEHFHHISPW